MAPPRKVSPPDGDLLVLIEDLTESAGHPPAVQELADEVGLASKAAMHRHLLRLRGLGLVTWVDGKARTLRVTEDGLGVIRSWQKAGVPG